MKIKLKDDWELDCIVIRKNGEKVTFKYDELTDQLIKIVEVKEEELKELLIGSDAPITMPISISNKPFDCDNPFRPVKPKVSHDKTKNKPIVVQNSRKISLETIKRIKIMAEEGKDNKVIAEYFHISPQLVNYWRKNTPKELT